MSRIFLDVKPFGQWAAALGRASMLDASIKRSIRAGQEKVARKLIKIVKGHILSQDLPWAPLGERTIKKKGHDKIYIDTYSYLQAIKFWQSQHSVHIGIPRNVVHPRTKIPIAEIAIWLELGTKKIPKRPLWEPSIREMGGVQGMNDIVAETLERKLAKQGWEIY